MTLSEAIRITEEIKPVPDGFGCVVTDIDDTVVTADPSVIGIWKNKPGEKPVRLTPDQYAKDPDSKNESWYDLREFRDPDRVYKSIVQGTPIFSTLRMLNANSKANYHICFLTARGLQGVVDSALKSFLNAMGEKGMVDKNLGEKLKSDISAAVNDASWDAVPASTPEKKAMVLRKLCGRYARVKFLDDDLKNIEAAKALNLPNLQVIAVGGAKGGKK